MISSNLQHECQTRTTRVRHERTNAIRVIQVQHECDTSATRTTRVRPECKTFDFDNYTSKNIFSYSFIYYMASERLQGEEQFHFKYYL